MATKKQLGLGNFGVKATVPAIDDNAEVRNDVKPQISKADKSSTVACTVRLPRAAWLKIQHLALDEGTSFQALAVAGLDAELKRRGLPGFDD